MDKRSMILGAGFGVIIVTCVFFVALQFTGKPEAAIQTVTESMSDEQVIEQARKLGMVMVKELPAASSATPSANEDVEKAFREENFKLTRDIGELMARLGEAEDKLQISEQALAEVQGQLNASNGTAPSPPPVPSMMAQAPDTATTPTDATPTDVTPTDATPTDVSPVYSGSSSVDMGDFTRITIPSGENSYSISALLSNGGVVDNAADFNVFVMENGKSTVLIAGTYDIPKDAAYEEVLEIITRVNVVEP